MEKLDKTIDYFIQHEIMNRFNDIELKEGKGIYISRDSFCDIDTTRKKVTDTKVDKINALVKKIKFKDSEYRSQILPEILQLLTDMNGKDKVNERLTSIIDRNEYCFPSNYDKDIYDITNIIMDNTLLVLHPILAQGKRKVPLVTFECKIESNKYVIENYKVQQEAFRVIIASILNCGIREVHGVLGDEFYELLNFYPVLKALIFLRL